MGYFKHHSIVVTGWDEKALRVAQRKAKDLGLCPSALTPPQTNRYRSFFIAPDGSKEGWDTSDARDSARGEFTDFLKRSGIYVDWCEVAFGGDFQDATVTAHGDEELTEKEGVN